MDNFEDIKIYMSKLGYDTNKISLNRLIELFRLEAEVVTIKGDNNNDNRR